MVNDNNILVIDDEVQIRRLLSITLSADGYKVHEAATGKEGIALTASLQPVLIILDLGLPDEDGLEIIKKLREWYVNPIIILSARKSTVDIITLLDNGANDYLTKPFHTGELLARIRVAIRLSQQDVPNTSTITIGNLVIDLANHIVRKNNKLVKLTSTEFSLLALLAKNEGMVLTHRFILNEIWGIGYTDQMQYLRVYITLLRKKIEEDPSRPKLINTESGIGYRFGIIHRERLCGSPAGDCYR